MSQICNHHRIKIVVVVAVLLLEVFSYAYADKKFGKVVYEFNHDEPIASARVEPIKEIPKHIETPDVVKSIYMSACAAGSNSFRESLLGIADTTEVNSIIIDVKDFSGTISFDSGLEGDAGTGCRVSDMKEFLELLRQKNIYRIARVTVFQDPFYSKRHPELAVKKNSDRNAIWADRKGINFIDVSARPYWDYIVSLSEKSHEIGFDEINFDYVRFPSDGNMTDIYFSWSNETLVQKGVLGKQIALENFFKYLSEKMRAKEIVTSADLFGMVTTNYDDLNIGQVLERALPHFDYIAPMVYPSHYPANFNGWKNPNTVPYELIHFVMGSAVERVEAFKNATTTSAEVAERVSVEQLRPWIQDFDYGGNYDVAEVKAQIQASYDVGLDSWMLWAPSNRYTKGALKVE